MSHPHPELSAPGPLPAKGLRIIPLGGLGEVGRNMTVFEYGGRLLVVDCGVLFPEDHHPGVDLILPDFEPIRDRLDDIDALVLHTGDFKMDQMPLDGRITDLRAFGRLGEEGVDLFMVDSTNAEVPGFTTSEKDIAPVLDRVFHQSANQRIIVACFASHIHRVQQVMDAAVTHNRKVAYVGRSMVRNMAVARDLGYLNVPKNTLVDAKELANYPPEKTVLISTGSQGEPLSALSRIAQRNHNFVHIEEGDTVVLASSLIPGNENAVYRVINGLARWGANVVHKGNALVHVSGHASAGELLYCYNIVKPRNVLPVHGEIRHMRANADLARAAGVERVVMAEDGVVVDLVNGVAKITGKVECGYVFVDESSVGDITESSLKDRRILGEEGFISVIVVVDSVTGKVSGGPEIHARGFVENDSTFDEIKPAIIDALDKAMADGVDDPHQLQQNIRRVVGRWVSNKHKRRPMIVPVVLEA